MTVVRQKKIILECNKNYTTLALNYMLNNSKGTILVSKMERRNKNNNIKVK